MNTVELGGAVQGSIPWEGVENLNFRFHLGFDSLEGLLPLLRFTPKCLLRYLSPFLGHGISVIVDPGNYNKNHPSRLQREFLEHTCIKQCSIISCIPYAGHLGR